MKLIKGASYTAKNNSIVVKVLSIFHVSEKGYTKAKLMLTINGRLMEKPKTYKLYHDRIKHWIRVYGN